MEMAFDIDDDDDNNDDDKCLYLFYRNFRFYLFNVFIFKPNLFCSIKKYFLCNNCFVIFKENMFVLNQNIFAFNHC